MKSTLKNMVLVLFSITAVAALLVALVNNITKDTIAQTEQRNKDLAKLEVLPEFEGEAVLEEKSRQIGDFTINVTEVKANGELVGYAVEAPSITKNGYGDRIYLMVGFIEQEGKTTVSGVKVISQKETPGLGANMLNPGNVLEQSIVGKSPAEVKFAVKKDGGSFDALTGSTISSRAYANAVETAYAGYLWAKGELPSTEDAKSGATQPAEQQTQNNETEPEAQKGEVSNE
jgi:electron transport complex protein RnfG